MRKMKFALKVPEISKARIRQLAERITPVMEFKEKGRCYIKPVDIFKESFTWEPEPGSKATDLKAICDITTYHPYGYIGYFKPSVAQVISQIPREHLDKVIAFEIVKVPDEFPENSSPEYEALDAGYHTATTRLYARE